MKNNHHKSITCQVDAQAHHFKIIKLHFGSHKIAAILDSKMHSAYFKTPHWLSSLKAAQKPRI